jgi:RNA polymerase sigma factor (sigma-70 family)
LPRGSTQRLTAPISRSPAHPRFTPVSTAIPPFQRFLDAHRDEVWRFLAAAVGQEDADDCFQETFISALDAYPRLRPDSNLRAWVLTIAHRKALDVHRGRAQRALPVAEVAQVADGSANAKASRSAVQAPPLRDEALWQAVNELPPRQRSAVLLRYVGDLPHRDIAKAVGCSEDAARRSLHEGLSKLRETVVA